MKGEVPAKGTSPFFLIIIKFGTFFTHFEMILKSATTRLI